MDSPQPTADSGDTTGFKRALLIGVHNTQDKDFNPLWKTHEDARKFERLICEVYGYEPPNVVLMLDDDDITESLRPTRANILKQIGVLMNDLPRNSRVVFYYSGHSDQFPNRRGTEMDGKDEAILPCDFDGKRKASIIDNVLKNYLVKALPSSCFLTAIFDTCHSATMLDLEHTRKVGSTWRETDKQAMPVHAPTDSIQENLPRKMSDGPMRIWQHQHTAGPVSRMSVDLVLDRVSKPMPDCTDLITNISPVANENPTEISSTHWKLLFHTQHLRWRSKTMPATPSSAAITPRSLTLPSPRTPNSVDAALAGAADQSPAGVAMNITDNLPNFAIPPRPLADQDPATNAAALPSSVFHLRDPSKKGSKPLSPPRQLSNPTSFSVFHPSLPDNLEQNFENMGIGSTLNDEPDSIEGSPVADSPSSSTHWFDSGPTSPLRRNFSPEPEPGAGDPHVWAISGAEDSHEALSSKVTGGSLTNALCEILRENPQLLIEDLSRSLSKHSRSINDRYWELQERKGFPPTAEQANAFNVPYISSNHTIDPKSEFIM